MQPNERNSSSMIAFLRWTLSAQCAHDFAKPPGHMGQQRILSSYDENKSRPRQNPIVRFRTTVGTKGEAFNSRLPLVFVLRDNNARTNVLGAWDYDEATPGIGCQKQGDIRFDKYRHDCTLASIAILRSKPASGGFEGIFLQNIAENHYVTQPPLRHQIDG